VSTPSERLEAEIWLETASPDISTEQQDAFFVAVDEYYAQYPTADRGEDFLATLREDGHAFALILAEIVTGGDEHASPSDHESSSRR